MPTPTKPVTTALGAALRARRANRTQEDAAVDAGVQAPTLSRIERGTHRPSIDTAMALARWLGWSVEEVMAAASTASSP